MSSRAEVDGTMKSFQEMISYDMGRLLIECWASAHSKAANTNSWKPIPNGDRQV